MKRKYTYKRLIHTPDALYDSLRDAAKQLNITPQGVASRCNSKTSKWKDWFIVELDEPVTK